MKKLLTLVLSIVLLFTTFFWSSCLKTDEEGGWAKEDKESYDQVINIQDEIGDKLDDWLQSMDSLDAVEEAYQAFISSDNVSSATINSQGITVQYTNGIRGGLLLNPEDDNSGIEANESFGNLMNKSGTGLKSLVNKRKMILINPHYWERSYYTDQVKSIDENNLAKVNMTLSTFYKDEEATVDRFTELSGYGIIQIYSHGLAWPKRENITDVYLLTGEIVNEATSKKYWDELKTGNIPIMKTFYHPEFRKNVYFLSEEFIANYNDFSNDTILFYGGFCYSFLGNWPDIIDGFADGAYTGHDWRVYTHKNANWCVNSLFALSDTTAEQPITLNDWFNNTEVPKSYWNENDQRTVHLMYAGDGNLKLWDDISVSVSLIALSSDGTPVSNPGEAGVAYPFKCNVNTNISALEYIWDIGDGSSPVSAGNEVNITWSEEGNYILTVTVKNQNTDEEIGKAQLSVTIGESGNNDVIEFLSTCNTMACQFGPIGAFTFSPDYYGGPLYVSMNPGNVVWSGLNFSGTKSENNGNTESISGSVSSDGQTVSYVAHLEHVSEFTNEIFQNFTITVSNLPLTLFDPDGGSVESPSARYGWTYAAENFQQYVTSVEGYEVDGEGTTHTITGVNWNSTDRLNFGFWKVNKK